MRIEGNLLRMSKGMGKAYSYKCFVSRETAEGLRLEEHDALLLKGDGVLFPTVFHKHRTSKNFTYAFTIPREIGDGLGKKRVGFEVAGVAKRKRGITSVKGKIDLLHNISNKTQQGQPFYMFDLGSKVYAWIYSRGSKGFLLNKFIPLREQGGFDFFELMGAFHCEGKKYRKGGKRNIDSMTFGNGNPEQITWFAESMKEFGFSKRDFRLQILHNERQDKKELHGFWASRGFTHGRISLYENKTVRVEKGMCLLIVGGATAGELFHEMLKLAKKLLLRKKEYSLRFFRGLSRGDIGISKNGDRMGSINYTTENQESATLFKRICAKVGVETHEEFFTPCVNGYWTVGISGSRNYRKLLALGAITHSERKRKLLKLFLGMRNNRFAEYLTVIGAGASTSGKVAEALGVSIISSRAYLKKLRSKGYLSGKLKGNKIAHSLTRKGERELAEYEELKKQEMVE